MQHFVVLRSNQKWFSFAEPCSVVLSVLDSGGEKKLEKSLQNPSKHVFLVFLAIQKSFWPGKSIFGPGYVRNPRDLRSKMNPGCRRP